MNLGNRALRPYDLIFLCPATLLMGFSWSVHLCQCAGEPLFRHSTLLEKCPLVNDRDRAPIFHKSERKECEDWLAATRLRAEKVIGGLTATFDDAGLPTHRVSVSDSQVFSLGTVLDCARRSSLAPRQFWKLRRGIDAIVRAETVTGLTLEVVIGHATFCSLLARPALTCFHSAYKYVQKIGPSRGVLLGHRSR